MPSHQLMRPHGRETGIRSRVHGKARSLSPKLASPTGFCGVGHKACQSGHKSLSRKDTEPVNAIRLQDATQLPRVVKGGELELSGEFIKKAGLQVRVPPT